MRKLIEDVREAQGLQEDADASRERNARQRMGYPYGYPSGKIADSPAQLGSGPGHQELPGYRAVAPPRIRVADGVLQ